MDLVRCTITAMESRGLSGGGEMVTRKRSNKEVLLVNTIWAICTRTVMGCQKTARKQSSGLEKLPTKAMNSLRRSCRNWV